MKIVYGQNLNSLEIETVNKIARECDILFDTARLLFYRNIDTVEKAKAFLSPGKHGFASPFLLSGMSEAVERITYAKDRGESVLIFGDYDADGVCATTILYNCLKEFGLTARFYVPEREDGYGLNVETIKKLCEERPLSLIITVDCGISDVEKIKELNLLGIDVVVTDHHEPPEIIPECVCINPKLSGQRYPFDGLCGAGVAYKLGVALIGNEADKYLDFVALATVADSMDLILENRDLVVEGLKLFNDTKRLRLCFKYLLGDSNKVVTAQTLAYVVAPRINAGGRMGDAKTALELFASVNPNKIFDCAVKLNGYNIARQAECETIYKEAKAKINENNLGVNEVILVADERWQPGFVGIVAAKLVEDYNKPVIVFAGHDGYYKGSARSVDDINIYEAIAASKDLLVAFGGHSQAAGVSVSKDNFRSLNVALNEYVKNLCVKTQRDKTVYAEWNIQTPLSIRFAREIDSLEPFGVGNRKPVFSTEVDVIESLPLKSGSVHYSFKTEVLEMLDFNGEKNVLPLSLPLKKKVLFDVNLSIYKNRESLKGYVKCVLPDYSDFSSLTPFIFDNEIAKLKNQTSKKVIEIPKEDVKKYDKNGTVFLATSIEVLRSYPEIKDLPVSLYDTDVKKGSAIVISPKRIPEGFTTAVYLNKQVILDGATKVYLVNEFYKNQCVDLISIDRKDVTYYYQMLLKLNGKYFNNAAQFAIKHFEEDEIYQAIFTIEVFLELGIFKIENGVFTFDEKVKNTLTNSQVYSKIYAMKG